MGQVVRTVSNNFIELHITLIFLSLLGEPTFQGKEKFQLRALNRERKTIE
jgi:hypothetical protein